MVFRCRFCDAKELVYVKANNETKAPPLVMGRIFIPSSVEGFDGATAHIKLEDTSRADGSARLISEVIITNISHRQKSEEKDTILPFAFYAPENFHINPKSDYSVRVWIDLDGDEKKSNGDLFSDQSYRVLTHGFESEVTVRL
jgi:hypothetical protein